MASSASLGMVPPVVRVGPGHSGPASTPAGDAGLAPQRGPGTAAQLQSAADQANRVLAHDGRKLEFVVDKTLKRMIVRVVDLQTNKVLRQVPNESMLAAARALVDHATMGVLIDQQA